MRASDPRRTRLFTLLAVALAFAGGYKLAQHVSVEPSAPTETAAPQDAKEEPGKASTFAGQDVLGFYGGQPGYWRNPRRHVGSQRVSEEDQAQLERILTLGYTDGSEAPSASEGVTIHDADHAFSGTNLITSAHDAETSLTDMNGKVLHTWRLRFKDVWPDADVPAPDDWPRGWQFWRRVHLFDNGDLIAIFEGFGLIKVDKDSNLLWGKLGDYHHDVDVAADGTIYVLGRESATNPNYRNGREILEDYVVELDPDGNELRRVSILKCMEDSAYRHLVRSTSPHPDIFHTNAVQVLSGRLQSRSVSFAKGHVLVSIHQLNTIAVLDLDNATATWALTGMWTMQHHPRVLEGGTIGVFDNFASVDHSKVVEVDPFTQEIVWRYDGTPEVPFRTGSCGAFQRLPNGNTLIVESDQGRAFEVTPEKEIVWEYVNPHRAGDDDQYIAVLFHVVRLPDTRTAMLLEELGAGETDNTQTRVGGRETRRPVSSDSSSNGV
ncbi:MAG: hypothetical protein GY851_15755 [bacterium]|nr:hypothetical protein [bacterium]